MIARIITVGFILLLLSYSIWWLWQRQPKPKVQETASTQIKQEKSREPEQNIEIFPKNFSILTKGTVKLEGKLSPNSYVLIYSNDTNSISKSEENGKFSGEIDLKDGLNLIGIIEYSADLKELSKKTLVYFAAAEDKKSGFGQIVYAGSVKNIFDNNFVISVTSGVDKNIKTTKSTTLEIPQDEEEATLSALDAVRVGDFAIATGEISQDTLTAKYFQIIREGKPQINMQVLPVKILSNVKNNALSASSITDSKITEFTLSKTAQILNSTNKLDIKQVEKNKIAIIVFTEEKNKKNVSLLYILP